VNTISKSALNKSVLSSADFNPKVAVQDNHLLVASHPSSFGLFSVEAPPSGELQALPAISAKSFRITNSTANNISVGQRQPVLTRLFNNSDLQMTSDSAAIRASSEVVNTPNGSSGVMRLEHTGDSAVYASAEITDNIIGVDSFFKIIDSAPVMSPFGVYSRFEDIDIQHPAFAYRVKNDEFHVKVGANETATGVAIKTNIWYRVEVVLSDFAVTDQGGQNNVVTHKLYEETLPNTGVWSEVHADNIVSDGVGLLSEILSQGSFYIGFTSESAAIQEIESLFAFKNSVFQEVLLAGTTKEYFCQNTLDEYSVSGAVSGFYRS